MKFKEILLLLVIIFAGIIFYHAQTGQLDLYIDLGDEFFSDYNAYTFESVQKISPPFPMHMEVKNQQGDLKIYGTDENEISIYIEKKVRHSTKERAKEIADELEILVTQEEQKVLVSSERGEHTRSHIRSDLEIYIPTDIDLYISNSYGTVELDGGKNVKITNKNGKVSVSNVQEKLSVVSSSNLISIENIGGDCQIEGLRSRINAKNINGSTTIKNKYGSIDLEDLSQGVIVNGLHCSIKGKNIEGQIEAENSYENIKLSNIVSAKIRSDNSPIEISEAKSNLDIKNKYSRILLNDIYGNIDIEGESLEIKGKNMFGELISISSSYRNIELDHFSSSAVISFSHGKITLYPSNKNIKPITVNGKYAEIDFILPPGLEIPMQAQTKSGKIKWELSPKGTEQISNGYSIINAFLKEGEKPTILLVTTYGNIQVREDS
ncbi:MAG: hypothetical protein J7L72_02590 [Candidatus Aminicenantes bacterium]|nr:hypothetical protein [Candidatus Aminicenantes bacterium]